MAEQGGTAEQSKTVEEPKVSAVELKKRAKADKQARRAAQKEQEGAPAEVPPATNGAHQEPSAQGQGVQQDQKGKAAQAKGQQQPKPSKQGGQDVRPERGGPSQPQSIPLRSKAAPAAPSKELPKRDNSVVELLSHLYPIQRRPNLAGVSKDVHPAVLALGLQISTYEICGSSARCVAMLLAFKEAIQAYTTPRDTSLPRHLVSHHLSPQIDCLRSCRPLAESMGNAIRWLKKLIVELDPDKPEHEAKDFICEEIDRFVHERITVTDQAIAASARNQIRTGSVVLTYAKSAIVEKTILQAHEQGTRFRLIVVDSRPLFEGKRLATSLMRAGLEVQYVPFSGLAHVVKDATLVLLGAHSMLSNGRLQSRVGTASIALQAHKADVPVIVCCESVKFSGKVALDSIVLNEIAPPEELLLSPIPEKSPIHPAGVATTAVTGKSAVTVTSAAISKDASEDDEPAKLKTLHEWSSISNLRLLNPMYDITPAEYIRMVICEYGSVPPSSVPVVHRLANEGM
ncbi:hypothetical protein LTR48_000117 [Friedmanniomyces endolithicus]|uniref:Translation initiation factor eIF2B subunit delta n=1 Tax=Friedmanniomyces endolithicus TaxID=329885 RepID=A0A4U0V1D5_9PEZI|nr:hypothetical protein LTS09_007825 [Friedmanniomyces endolithicus]KAK0352900.1 hypothetical protein LTR94_018979 [Friedmanniomyces endolithicus]KAK0774386.1 hypothetical protein LTR59_014907 [Friedmanniomyces endolithicus]KAK0779046.1 hypothetical protein LTR75_015473 [Friedmanniomyces endolithicus]KAK0792854.1 hypothetical protein LTR38_009715 [Friedmanniomyces endolithicus]